MGWAGRSMSHGRHERARGVGERRRSGSLLVAEDIISGMESSMATAPAMRARRVRRPRSASFHVHGGHVGGFGRVGARERGVVAGVADGGDERVGVDGGGGGDLRGVRHEVDAGGGDAGDGFEGVLDVDLAGGAGHALDRKGGDVVWAPARSCSCRFYEGGIAGGGEGLLDLLGCGGGLDARAADADLFAWVPGNALSVCVTRRMQEPQCMLSIRRTRVDILI